VTNSIRELISNFNKGFVPKHWREEYLVSNTVSIQDWIVDLSNRLKTLHKYVSLLSFTTKTTEKTSFWIGGMFDANAFINATRQLTAQVF
jgi:hypothetical protein